MKHKFYPEPQSLHFVETTLKAKSIVSLDHQVLKLFYNQNRKYLHTKEGHTLAN